MLPFAFDKSVHIQQEPTYSHKQQLLTNIFMLMLENQRLTKNNSSKELYFSFHGQENQSQQLKIELQLKKIQIDNLTLARQELKQQTTIQQCKIKEQEQTFILYQKNSQKEIHQMKSQLHSYKTKYEQELGQKTKYHKQQIQLQKYKKQFEEKEVQRTALISKLNNDLIASVSSRQKILQELQKSNKQLKRQNCTLKETIFRKDQECMNLKETLNDAPKIQELNRWIGKVKQYQQKQSQACARISQMGQDLCISKQKYRKLQHEFKQLQKLKLELQETITAGKENQDSMTIYFDRLTAYESSIKQLESQLQKLQSKNKEIEVACSRKTKKLQEEKEEAVTQWQVIAEQMNKQRTLLHAMQNELDQYSRLNTIQTSQSHSSINTIQSRLIDKRQSKVSSRQQFPKCSSNELTRRQLDFEKSKIQQRIVFHNDRVSHSVSRLQTQHSSDSLTKDISCQDCSNRGKVARCSSTDRALNSYNFSHRNQYKGDEVLREKSSNTVINDQKRMLMDKLNYLHPHQSLRLNDKSINSLYTKNYRQINSSYQGIVKHNSKGPSQTRLNILKTTPREEKENMNQILMKKYSHLLTRV